MLASWMLTCLASIKNVNVNEKYSNGHLIILLVMKTFNVKALRCKDSSDLTKRLKVDTTKRTSVGRCPFASSCICGAC